MKQKMKAGDWVQVETIIEQVLVDEAWQQEQVPGPVLGEDLGEDVGKLWQMLTLPLRRGPIHWRSKHHAEPGASLANDAKLSGE